MTDPNPEQPAESEVRIRRAPRLGVFIGLGAALGIIVTLILTSAFPDDAKIGFTVLFGYFAVIGVPAGIAVGATVGIVLDRVSSRRARTVRVAREVVGDPDAAESRSGSDVERAVDPRPAATRDDADGPDEDPRPAD